jgi:hypothetical protein
MRRQRAAHRHQRQHGTGRQALVVAIASADARVQQAGVDERRQRDRIVVVVCFVRSRQQRHHIARQRSYIRRSRLYRIAQCILFVVVCFISAHNVVLFAHTHAHANHAYQREAASEQFGGERCVERHQRHYTMQRSSQQFAIRRYKKQKTMNKSALSSRH